jgi:DNA-binding response OmpR family regulator
MAKDLIFIVEDDPAWAATLQGSLKKHYQVKHFTTGEAAVTNLKENPKIVILDYHLEGKMTGLDTLNAIKKEKKDAYVIMFSAQDSVQVALDTLKNGAYDYVPKGETALNRLNFILNKIERNESLKREAFELRIRLRRYQLIMLLIALLGIFTAIFLYLR